ncbi:flagellar hook-associated protein 1 FlgK [Butyrivibrio proteoclasticus]|uniref:Flagellar hook-associated protein 1 n=1 Tax=Butyrivibrio proteoclasticus TaxID=43305 RepID=A0A1I5Y6P1_9FIRM|nr:flagellar basal body rod C-terminal domain-containing protein [Butyrivibrio proteoclasticus]SFQ39901.1 flagellar hook-associated protein 1 FlgK [Butyrivibrio proteoclasticus]
MVSQFFGLNIAASGLRAANAALNTTANNVSNKDTDGYSRQAVEQQASNALRVFTTYGCAGAGVDTIAIERIRNSFYDFKFRNNEALLGNVTQKNYYNGMIEQYLDDDGITGFSTLFTKMQASLQSVMTAAGTTETKSTYVSNVKSITEYFNNVYTSLQNLQSDVNAEIKLCADRITAIGTEIASLNQQINTIEMTGTTANELRDKRDVLLDDLSKIVSIETKESKVIDETQPDRDTGATRFQVWVAGSYELVDMYEYKQMVCVAREVDESVNQNDISGLYDIKWANSRFKDGDNVNELADFALDSRLIGGELQGLLAIRDGNNGQYFNGKGNGVEVDPQSDSCTITVDVASSYLMDMGKCTLPVSGTIHIGAKFYKYDSWSYDGGSKYTFTLDPDSLTSIPDDNRAVSVGYYNKYQGLPYYMEQMNEWIRKFSDEVNKIMVSGYTSDSLDGVYLLTGSQSTNSSAQYSYEELTSLSENKGYYNITAGNFEVNRVLLDNADRMATKSDITEGESEFGNLTKLNDMFNNKEVFRGATSGEFLTKVLADVALNRSNSDTLEKTYTALANTIDNQRLSESGVDEDEEAVNLVKFQNAYNLSSKMIQTLTEVYDRLILQTGV